MELSLISHHKNLYPVCGFFVEDSNLEAWLKAISLLGLNPSLVKLHILPSKSADELWGCLVITHQAEVLKDLRNYPSAHRIGGKLIIPEKTLVQPELTPYDFDKLFQNDTYVLHPDVGLYRLTDPLSLEAHLDLGNIDILRSTRPEDFQMHSGEIISVSIEAIPKEELKHELESSKKRETFKDAPLTLNEKLRLQFYENFLITEDGKEGKVALNTKGSVWEEIGKRLGIYGPDTEDRIIKDYRDLQKRNKKEVDKLMDLLNENPEEALRYAIPLDEKGSTRGEVKSRFKLQDRGIDLSIFGKFTWDQGLGGTVGLEDDTYQKLQSQYELTAQRLKDEGDFENAAYIYLKLLKRYSMAANTLREGKYFEKAAFVYLEYVKNEQLAAECYEEGMIYIKAIDLYEKMGKLEKVGDLYMKLGNRIAANSAYHALIDKKLKKNQYVQAAKVSEDKMQNLAYAKEILLSGWKNMMDPYNCLSKYLAYLTEAKETWAEIQRIHKEDVDARNEGYFLKVLKKEYAHKDENEDNIRNLAYTLISKLLEEDRISPQELQAFNHPDTRLQADIMRYELRKYNRS